MEGAAVLDLDVLRIADQNGRIVGERAGVDHAQAVEADVAPAGNFEQAGQVIRQGDATSVDCNRFAWVGGVGDGLTGAAGVLWDDPFFVDSGADVDGIPRDKCTGRLLDRPPGLRKRSGVGIVPRGSNVIDRPLGRRRDGSRRGRRIGRRGCHRRGRPTARRSWRPAGKQGQSQDEKLGSGLSGVHFSPVHLRLHS